MIYNKKLAMSIEPKIDWLIKIQDMAELLETVSACKRGQNKITLRDLELINKAKLENLTCKKIKH